MYVWCLQFPGQVPLSVLLECAAAQTSDMELHDAFSQRFLIATLAHSANKYGVDEAKQHNSTQVKGTNCFFYVEIAK